MSKQCPFCNRAISTAVLKCPHCHRAVVEYIGVNPPTSRISWISRFKLINKFISGVGGSLKSRIKHLLHFVTHPKFRKPSFNLNYLGLIPLIALMVISRSGNANNLDRAIMPDSSSSNTPERVLPANYNRLPNGQIISSGIENLPGLGTLEIDNGTDNDAVVKLVNTKQNTLTMKVYVQAKSKYTIVNIHDDEYVLYFQTGKDWNEDTNKFMYYPSFLKFSESFKYTTASLATNTRYTTYQITLNPVAGGTATTNAIKESEFEKF